MDWMKLRSYSGKRQMQKKTHCASPLPAKTASVAMIRTKSKAKTSQEHPNLLSKFSCDPQVKSTVGKKKGKMKSTVTKALPKIQEYSEVTQKVCPSSEERIELNCSEYRSMEVINDINDMETTPLKDSLHLASASTQSLRYSEATSGMTLPTGVSDFLLDCLDMETTLDCSYTKTIDSTSSYSSPEIFRDETGLEDTASPETHLACKNSTLLDTSKAINIDKMSQLPDLSKILGTPLGIQGQYIASRKQSRQKLPSEPTNTSAVVAGKQVCKILSANEKRLKSQPSGVSLLLPERKKKIEDQQSVKRKCRKKITFENVCSISSPHVLPSYGKNSSKEMCGIVASKPPNADKLDLLSTHEALVQDNCLAYKECPNVNSEAIVPLSPQRTIYQYLRSPPEICSIIQASPGFRPLKVLQHPTNKKEGFLPPEATEDIITSSKTWTCGNGS
ncbi:meiosis-specific kinetochore protein [Pituophis catenifer annectens]|uniref:meiosis-specific kinetochore protein n=1 Tax=Pituophis catenifer annectens TaxID=94852 RepID=UPI003991ECF9